MWTSIYKAALKGRSWRAVYEGEPWFWNTSNVVFLAILNWTSNEIRLIEESDHLLRNGGTPGKMRKTSSLACNQTDFPVTTEDWDCEIMSEGRWQRERGDDKGRRERGHVLHRFQIQSSFAMWLWENEIASSSDDVSVLLDIEKCSLYPLIEEFICNKLVFGRVYSFCPVKRF